MAESRYGAICSKLEFVENMSMLRLYVLLGLIVPLYGLRRFLEEVEVAQAVALLESGHTQKSVAKTCDALRSVFARVWRRYQETAEFYRRGGQGRHLMPPQREDCYEIHRCKIGSTRSEGYKSSSSMQLFN